MPGLSQALHDVEVRESTPVAVEVGSPVWRDVEVRVVSIGPRRIGGSEVQPRILPSAGQVDSYHQHPRSTRALSGLHYDEQGAAVGTEAQRQCFLADPRDDARLASVEGIEERTAEVAMEDGDPLTIRRRRP